MVNKELSLVQVEVGPKDAAIDTVSMTFPGLDKIGVALGLDPYLIHVPALSVKSIEQSSPLAGVRRLEWSGLKYSLFTRDPLARVYGLGLRIKGLGFEFQVSGFGFRS